MANVDFDNGNDDWKALDIPKFGTGKKCREWCETQPVANAFVWVADNVVPLQCILMVFFGFGASSWCKLQV